MMNEEQYIRSRMGNGNHFRVPDGYFDRLADSVMAQIPEETKDTKPGRVVSMRPWLYAAACLLVAVLTATAYFLVPETTGQSVVATTTVSASDTYVDEAADYVMADNNDIYACLASDF